MIGKLHFTSMDHKERFLVAMEIHKKIYLQWFDSANAAAYYILTSDKNTWDIAQRHIEDSAIDFKAILALPGWSSGYVRLLQLAANLYDGYTHIDPIELTKLDGKNTRIALSAIDLRLTGLATDELEAVTTFCSKID